MISNILEQEDIIKGLPDAALQKEARAPSGALQQFLVVSEIKRRTDMRKSHENQMKEQPQGTVADQIVMEGIAGMMPQQGVGMPPQMGPQMPPQGMPPQGGPQMPPQMPPPGMPPMGMASGGIVRMANGGLTGMPGENALAGMQAELMARARVLAQTTGRSIEEAYQALLREAQMNMPDYSMIAPAGMGELPSMDMPSGTRPPKAVTGGIDLGALGDIDSAVGDGFMSTYRLIPQYSTRDYLGEGLSAIEPVGDYIAGKGDALLEGIGTLRELLPDNPARSVKDFALGPFADNREMIAAADRIRPVVEDMNQVRMDEQARLLADLQLDAMEGDEQAAKQVAKLLTRTDAQVQGGGVEVQPNAGAGVASGSALGDSKGDPDAETVALETVIAAQGEGESPARASFNSAISSIDELISDLKNKETQQSPALDLSELIADSKRMAKANALMQLGAGIAAGDTAKALSAAGTAAAKGMQDARTLDMKKRLAEYQAGREDIRRGEQRDLDIAKLGLQREQLSLLSEKYQNELAKAASVGRNELFRTASSIVDAAMAGSTEVDPDARKQQAYALMNEFLTLYAPTFGVTSIPTLPTGGSGAGAAVDPAQFDRTGG